MKTNRNLYLFAAALVAGTMGMTSCSNEEMTPGNVNPTYDGESVKTQFAINIPAAGKNTRLAQDIVQGQNPATFRGMTNIRLVPFTDATISGTTTTSIKPIALGAIGKNDLQTNGSYKVYNDVDIPVGVNSFLFYGEAAEAATGSLTNGSIIPSYEVTGWPLKQQVDQIQFDLEPIIGEGSVTTSQTTLAQMLTDIAGVSGTTGSNTAWSAVGTGDLKNLYDNFTSLKAGSANSIKAALQELYNSVKDDKVTNVDDLKEKIAEKIIETYFDATGPTDGKYTLNWKDAIADDIKTFPNNLGLPDGSQQLKFATNTFSYVTPLTDATGGNILQQTAYNKYVYPASLFYTVNTPIRVSDETKASNGSYTGTDWSNILQTNYGTDNGTVSSTTQSIALVSPIQYAVASLNLYVRFADDYIYDNGDNWPSTDKPVGKIAVPITGDGFPLNGILIGGQKPVKWDFTTTDTEDNAAWTIYDASTGSAAVKKSDAYPIDPTAYTLALETKGVSSGAAQGETVHFALEMTNASGSDFIGKDGIVPAGGKFYLVGNLVSDTEAGEGKALKVFEKDHKTIAKVTITSLKSAYNCIPDLRSPKLELGLSVDLVWEEGLVQDVVIP